jgi:hypothetical protein
MKDAVIIAFALLTTFALLSWASAPSAYTAEHTIRMAREQQIESLQTQVAVLKPVATVPKYCPIYPRC